LYEDRYQTKSFEEYYEVWHSNRCLGSGRLIASRYVVTDKADQPIGYGNCFTRKNTCSFQFKTPFNRTAFYQINAPEINDVQAIHQGVVQYLIAATDRDTTTGFTLPDVDALEPEPFDPSEYKPSPTFSTMEIDPVTIPTGSFKQILFDLAAPDDFVYQSTKRRIVLNGGSQPPSGIPLDRFASYWVGKLVYSKPTRQMINIDASFGLTLVRVNGVIVYKYAPKAITSSDLQAALDNPVFNNGDLKLGVVAGGSRPKDYFAVEFPAGENIVEIEYINDSHSIRFMASVGDEITYLTRSAAQAQLRSVGPQDAELYYFGVHSSARPDNRITLRLPETDTPAILILDSLNGVVWEIETSRDIVATIVSSNSPSTRLIGGDYGAVTHLNKPIGVYKEGRGCTLNDLAETVEDLTGVPLAGYAMDYDIGLMNVTGYTPGVEDPITEDDSSLRKACS
jgi:hypothetical protein